MLVISRSTLHHVIVTYQFGNAYVYQTLLGSKILYSIHNPYRTTSAPFARQHQVAPF